MLSGDSCTTDPQQKAAIGQTRQETAQADNIGSWRTNTSRASTVFCRTDLFSSSIGCNVGQTHPEVDQAGVGQKRPYEARAAIADRREPMAAKAAVGYTRQLSINCSSVPFFVAPFHSTRPLFLHLLSTVPYLSYTCENVSFFLKYIHAYT